ncbi:MAG: NAD(+)/NADH kinase [Thermoplasmatota archaeon]
MATFGLLAQSDGATKTGPRAVSDEARRVLRALVDQRVPHVRLTRPQDPKLDAAKGDALVVVGDSAFLLSVLRSVPPRLPVLGVGGAGFGVLTETTVEEFETTAAARLRRGDFRVEEVDRMSCRVGDERVLAVNEAALVATTPGQIVRYSLWVDDELVWRDRGDGLIVATPTGSTAYALSAGGPVVLAKTRVFSIVPICSSEGQKPVIVSEDASLHVTDLEAPGGVTLVADGRERVKIARGDTVRLARAKDAARFIRLGEKRYTQILGKLKTTRSEAGPALIDAPPSAKFLLKLLEYEGPLTQQEMIHESSLSARTVRNGVGWLVARGYVGKEPSLRDARQDVYTLARSSAKRGAK